MSVSKCWVVFKLYENFVFCGTRGNIQKPVKDRPRDRLISLTLRHKQLYIQYVKGDKDRPKWRRQRPYRAAAHHRLNFILPFPDGNGRASRLMSHAMAHMAGIGAHGLWSISRGLARGLESRGDYKRLMDDADSPRRDDLDGRGNLSQSALSEFVLWFLRVALDQVQFMSSLIELDTLSRRLRNYVELNDTLKREAAWLLEEALIRGEFERGEIVRITGLPERSARRVLRDVTATGLLASNTPKGRCR